MKIRVSARVWVVHLGTLIDKEFADTMRLDYVEDETTEGLQDLLGMSSLR